MISEGEIIVIDDFISLEYQEKIKQAVRDDLFRAENEFKPVSAAEDIELYEILINEQPVVHTLGE